MALGSVGLLPLSRIAAAQPSSDRYVVGTRSRTAVDAARAAAVSVGHVFDFGAIGQAVSGRFTPQALEALARRTDVRYVEPDVPVSAVGIDATDAEYGNAWGVDRVDAEKAHTATASVQTGLGVHVAIIDTGIDSDHADLAAHLGEGVAFLDADGVARSDWEDDHGHGTHCAGIAGAIRNASGVVGTGPDVVLHAVKTLSSSGGGYSSDSARGIKYAADKGWHVASLSLGSTSASSVSADACTYAYGKGVLLVAAAGNDGPSNDTVRYPAAFPEVIAVSATTKSDALRTSSSRGPEIELAAPGSSILSTTFDGSYGTKSGTSMACPHVSGAGAVLMAMGHSNVDARRRLGETAENIGLPANEQGKGLLDVEAAVAPSVQSPAVTTHSASNVTATAATLNGTLDGLGSASSADVRFEWGLNGSLSNATAWQATSATGPFSARISGLQRGKTYSFRAVARTAAGTTAGDVLTFRARKR